MTSPATSTTPATVIVVGGGLAGLSASAELCSRGCRVILIERRRALGGRASSHLHRQSGEILDLGPHTVIQANRHFLKHLSRVGTRHLIEFAPTLSIRFVHSFGVQTRLASYSPIPHTTLWEPCLQIRPEMREEPLLTNNTIFPLWSMRYAYQEIQELKHASHCYNRKVKTSY